MSRSGKTIGILLLFLSLNCEGRNSSSRHGRTIAEDHLDVFRPTVNQFLAAAERGDTARMAALAVDKYPVLAARALVKEKPNLVRSAQLEMTVKAHSDSKGDTAGVVYAVAYEGHTEELSFTFIRDGQHWRIYRLVLPRQL